MKKLVLLMSMLTISMPSIQALSHAHFAKAIMNNLAKKSEALAYYLALSPADLQQESAELQDLLNQLWDLVTDNDTAQASPINSVLQQINAHYDQ